MDNITLRKITVKGQETNEFVKGRISGVIEGVLNNPKRRHYGIMVTEDLENRMNDLITFKFDADEADYKTICSLLVVLYDNILISF